MPCSLFKPRGSCPFLNGDGRVDGEGVDAKGERRGGDEKRGGNWLVCKTNFKKMLFK